MHVPAEMDRHLRMLVPVLTIFLLLFVFDIYVDYFMIIKVNHLLKGIWNM